LIEIGIDWTWTRIFPRLNRFQSVDFGWLRFVNSLFLIEFRYLFMLICIWIFIIPDMTDSNFYFHEYVLVIYSCWYVPTSINIDINPISISTNMSWLFIHVDMSPTSINIDINLISISMNMSWIFINVDMFWIFINTDRTPISINIDMSWIFINTNMSWIFIHVNMFWIFINTDILEYLSMLICLQFLSTFIWLQFLSTLICLGYLSTVIWLRFLSTLICLGYLSTLIFLNIYQCWYVSNFYQHLYDSILSTLICLGYLSTVIWLRFLSTLICLGYLSMLYVLNIYQHW